MFKIKKLSAIIAGAFMLMPLSGMVWGDSTDMVDLPSNASTKQNVTIGSFETGAFEQAQDVDWMRVRLEAHVKYKIKMTSDTLPEITLKIASTDKPNRILLQANQRDLLSVEAIIVYTPEFTADYFLMASADNQSIGYYIISVEELERPMWIQSPPINYPYIYPFPQYPGSRGGRHYPIPKKPAPIPTHLPRPPIITPPMQVPVPAPIIITDPISPSQQVIEDEQRQKSERERQMVISEPMPSPQQVSQEEEGRQKAVLELQMAQPPADDTNTVSAPSAPAIAESIASPAVEAPSVISEQPPSVTESVVESSTLSSAPESSPTPELAPAAQPIFQEERRQAVEQANQQTQPSPAPEPSPSPPPSPTSSSDSKSEGEKEGEMH